MGTISDSGYQEPSDIIETYQYYTGQNYLPNTPTLMFNLPAGVYRLEWSATASTSGNLNYFTGTGAWDLNFSYSAILATTNWDLRSGEFTFRSTGGNCYLKSYTASTAINVFITATRIGS